MGSVKHAVITFCKAQLSAQVATVVDFTVTAFLTEVFGIWYLIATFIGALSGGIVNCVVNYHWVFQAQTLKKRFVAIKYLMVWGGSILLNTGGTYLLTELSSHHYLISKVIVAVLVGFFWNYQLQRLFVYRDNHLKDKLGRLRTHHEQVEETKESL
ncbi:MAG: GtrA family protein [Prevotella sp.]|nr:GtrA family protein [Prevotella sp.]